MSEISITKLASEPKNSSGLVIPQTLDEELESELVQLLNSVFVNNDIKSVSASVRGNEVSIDIDYKISNSWVNIKFNLTQD
jgi:hypothetical protein